MAFYFYLFFSFFPFAFLSHHSVLATLYVPWILYHTSQIPITSRCFILPGMLYSHDLLIFFFKFYTWPFFWLLQGKRKQVDQYSHFLLVALRLILLFHIMFWESHVDRNNISIYWWLLPFTSIMRLINFTMSQEMGKMNNWRGYWVWKQNTFVGQ